MFAHVLSLSKKGALSFSLNNTVFSETALMAHLLSTEPKRLKSQHASDVLSTETETQHPPSGHSYTLLLQQSIPTMGTFFRWKGRQGRVAVSEGRRLGLGGLWVRTGQGDDNAVLCVTFWSGVEGHHWGTERGLCVRHFECRLCYTVNGSTGVQRERGHLFCGCYECRVSDFGSRQSADVFAHFSAQSSVRLFRPYGNHRIN